jgi:hydrogenase nickel incorporation protein HypA/HybF
MHELTIASALVDQVCDHAARAGARTVTEIRVRMGALSGVARALYFCFPSAARGTRCEDAVLYIEEVPLTVMCDHCHAVKSPAARYNFRCPDCGHPTPKVLTGREMQLVSIALGKPKPPAPGGASLDHTETMPGSPT